MNRVVVTGGAGFIGSHLVRELLARGVHVAVLDDLSTGKIENVPAGVELVCKSVAETHLQKDFFNSYIVGLFRGADYIFHLAAIASVPQSVKEPETAYKVNVGGTIEVLKAARATGVKKVILASSCAVYGMTDSKKQDEKLPPSPISPYARTKLQAEEYCKYYSEHYGLPTACLRYFNVYGEGQNPHSQYALAVPAFIHNAKQGLPLTIYGDGKQSRDFIFIDDIINATIYAAESDMGGVYNVGSGKSTSVNTLAKDILRLTGSKSQLLYSEPRQGDPRHACADITKLVSAGFNPKWSLKQGLGRIIRGLQDTEHLSVQSLV